MRLFAMKARRASSAVSAGVLQLLGPLALISVLNAQPLVLEDFACYQITNAVPSGGNTNLTCITPHGLPVGSQYHIWVQGGTGQWAALNSQFESAQNGAAIAATDNRIIVNDASLINPGKIQLWGPNGMEIANVISSDQGHLYLGPGTGLGCNANGRGCTGGVAAQNIQAQCGCIVANLTGPTVWNATAVNANTLQIPVNSSAFSPSFQASGQVIYMRRALYSTDPASPNVRTYSGQSWSAYDRAGPDGMTVTIPACSNFTDAYECSRGFAGPNNDKGYGYGSATISNFTVSSGVATILFSSPFPDTSTLSGAGTLTAMPAAKNGMGALVWIYGMDETLAGYGKLNRPYIVSDVIMSGANKVGIHANISNVPNGTYTGSNPTMRLLWPSDGYIDSNWMNGDDSYPASTARSFIKSGTWDPSYNRFRFWIKYDGTNRPIASSSGFNFGTYNFFATDPRDKVHGYHAFDFVVNSGQWVKVELNQRNQGLVGYGGGVIDISNDPYINAAPSAPPSDYPAWQGGARHYFDSLERWYIDGSVVNAQPLTGATETFKRFEFDKATGEPEEYVCARTIQYDGTKYLLSVVGLKQTTTIGVVPVTYDFYYSTSGSLKTTGLSNGIHAGSSAIPNDSLSPTAYFTGPNMPLASTVWWGIRPTAPVLRTSGNGASPILIWSVNDYLWSAGDHVTTANISGNTAANVTNAVIQATYPKQTWFRFQPNSGAWNTPSTLSGIVSDGSTCTVSLTVTHNLTVDWPIYVNDGVPAGGPPGQRFYYVSRIDSPTQFEFSCPGTTAGTYNTDYDSIHHLAIQSMPGFSVSGTGNGAFSTATQGTMVSTDATKNFAEISFSPLSSGCSITNASLPNGLVGSAYSQSLQTTNCTVPLTWSLSAGSLCAGLSYSASTGAITGTPSTAQTCSFTMQVTDNASHTTTQPLSITITNPASQSSACDINGDGVVNDLDVNLELNMALGKSPCTVSLTQTGTCTVVDVQRVINAASGGACRVGQ
jgi:hypothetical protein